MKKNFFFKKNEFLFFDLIIWFLCCILCFFIIKLILLLLSPDMAFVWKSFFQRIDNDEKLRRILSYFKTIERLVSICLKKYKTLSAEYKRKGGK